MRASEKVFLSNGPLRADQSRAGREIRSYYPGPADLNQNPFPSQADYPNRRFSFFGGLQFGSGMVKLG